MFDLQFPAIPPEPVTSLGEAHRMAAMFGSLMRMDRTDNTGLKAASDKARGRRRC